MDDGRKGRQFQNRASEKAEGCNQSEMDKWKGLREKKDDRENVGVREMKEKGLRGMKDMMSPLSLVTVTKLQIQRTLETIYEEEDDDEKETLCTLPNSCNNFFIPNPQPSALFAWSKLLLRMMYVVAPRWISAVNQPNY
ncbi:hypothetical protein V8G54_007562 [Vigna mungo]|uniref:Uncharacterized protein n=1 Tax=Vigna mungo TaxID=3915 RepID=A0AAQ3P235_VIGMU